MAPRGVLNVAGDQMKKTFLALLVVGLLSGLALAQNKKPWSEWDKTETDKMLNGSPWGQTQTETDTSQLVWASVGNDNPGGIGPKQAMTVNYRVRLFSAKPIREAFARKVMLGNSKIAASQLNSFVSGDYSEVIVVAVTFDGADRSYTGIIGQAFDSGTTGTLKNKVYLERQDGKRLFLDEYAAPPSDGTGAKFVFPRNVDGKPFIGTDGAVRFVADMGRGGEISWRFKLSEMKYNGNLEF